MPLKSPYGYEPPSSHHTLQQLLVGLSMLPIGGMTKLSPELEIAGDLAGLGKGATKLGKVTPKIIPEALEGDAPPISEGMSHLLSNPPTYKGEMEALLSLQKNLSKMKGMKNSVPYQQVVQLMSEIGPNSEPRALRAAAIKRQMIQSSFDNILRAISKMGQAPK